MTADNLRDVLAEHEPVLGVFASRAGIIGCSCLSARDYRAAGYRSGQRGWRDHLAATVERLIADARDEQASHVAELQAYIDRMPYLSDVDDAYERGRAERQEQVDRGLAGAYHIGHQNGRKEQAAADRARIEAVLSEVDGWAGYDSRDTGHVFLADSVHDLVADLRAALDSEGGEQA
jgi:hypothetical protein